MQWRLHNMQKSHLARLLEFQSKEAKSLPCLANPASGYLANTCARTQYICPFALVSTRPRLYCTRRFVVYVVSSWLLVGTATRFPAIVPAIFSRISPQEGNFYYFPPKLSPWESSGPDYRRKYRAEQTSMLRGPRVSLLCFLYACTILKSGIANMEFDYLPVRERFKHVQAQDGRYFSTIALAPTFPPH